MEANLNLLAPQQNQLASQTVSDFGFPKSEFLGGTQVAPTSHNLQEIHQAREGASTLPQEGQGSNSSVKSKSVNHDQVTIPQPASVAVQETVQAKPQTAKTVQGPVTKASEPQGIFQKFLLRLCEVINSFMQKTTTDQAAPVTIDKTNLSPEQASLVQTGNPQFN